MSEQQLTEGRHFAGWGFMRFWNSVKFHGNQGVPNHGAGSDHEGDGWAYDQLFHGRLHETYHSVSLLGASPAEIRNETAKRRRHS